MHNRIWLQRSNLPFARYALLLMLVKRWRLLLLLLLHLLGHVSLQHGSCCCWRCRHWLL
jgi:hypothetical protein